jgi:K(+)-stimulated pyrophosphate-energized sodium pump
MHAAEYSAAIREARPRPIWRASTTIAMVGVVVLLLAWWLLSITAAIGFLINVQPGAAGFIGMHVSVRANAHRAAASNSLAAGLDIAFNRAPSPACWWAWPCSASRSITSSTHFMGLQPSRVVIDSLVSLGFGAS